MNILVTHSSNFDYKKELYKPIKDSVLSSHYNFILPFEVSDFPNFKERLRKGNADIELVIAEVSYPSTGQGIELGWADIYEIPVICIYRKGTQPSGALKIVSNVLLEYKDSHDMLNKIDTFLKAYA